MPNYVETGYSENYTEGDTVVAPPVVPVVETVPCDLTGVMELLNALVAKNDFMTEKIDSLVAKNAVLEAKLNDIKSTVNSNNFKLESFETKITLNNQPVNDYMNLKEFPAGTKVNIQGFADVCEVVSSKYLPLDALTYTVVYTIAYMLDGVVKISDFPSSQVFRFVPRHYVDQTGTHDEPMPPSFFPNNE
jgi:hypothetical protein